VPGLFLVAAQVCASIDTKSDTAGPVFVEAEAMIVALQALADLEVFPANTTLKLPDPSHIQWIAAAVSNMWKISVYHGSTAGPSVDSKKASMAAALTNIQTFFERHPQNPFSADWDKRGVPYQLQLCDKEFLRHCLMAMRLSPRTDISRAAALLLRCASNVSYVNAAIMDPSVKGVKQILDAISSTSHDNSTLLDLVTCISNIAAFDDGYIMRIAEESGLELLQPVVLHDDPRISLLACVAVASIACLKDCAELVEKSQSLPVVENVLRAITPGSLVINSNWSTSDSKILLRMMSADAGVAVQLTALHFIASSFHLEHSVEFFNTPICHGAFRTCASSPDPFVYAASVFIMRKLHLAIPQYRSSHLSDPSSEINKIPVVNWSVEQVCDWVTSKSFKAYRAVFRDGLVNGQMLLTITPEILATNGIHNMWHRQAIMVAVQELKELLAKNASGVLVDQPNLERTCDVFISYRRIGGSDFAQLLKVCFQKAGIDVFLDVDNLGQGQFDEQLWKRINAAKNVVLVWTKGCMDRFLDEEDIGRQDFVRKEYALALKLKKNIVPVKHEDFVFADKGRVPADVQHVLGLNAIPWISAYREASFDRLKNALM